MCMTIITALFHLFHREIMCLCTQSKRFSTNIYSICTIIHCYAQYFQAPCRDQ